MGVCDIGMYSRSITESSKSALVEVLRILASYKDYLVLSGGWAPYFILEKFGVAGQHCGSIDIDFVLHPDLVDHKVYETIASLIEKRGYSQHVTEKGDVVPFRFHRTVKSALDGVEHSIQVDFITEPEAARRLSGEKFLEVQKDLQAVIIRGSGIVFSHNFGHTIEGVLPSGASTKAAASISDIVGSLTTKGLALKGRYKEKDAYDIYFALRHYRGGAKRVAEIVGAFTGEPVVAEALKEIRSKFETPRSEGPFQVAYFLAPGDGKLQERIQGEAHTILRLFFSNLKQI
jgi:hypothetical protein